MTTATQSGTEYRAGTRPPAVPPLMPGDHLSRAEFERRYGAMPDLKKAELIEGIVYMPSPVSFSGHSTPHVVLLNWLSNYWAGTVGVVAGDNGSLRLDLDNMPQPDAFLMIRPGNGGQARIGTDDYIEGAPELVAEIAASSASYDLHEKKRVYRRNGVREYIVWRVFDRQIDYFVLREGEYHLLAADAGGVQRSEAFPGLWLDGGAMINEDLAKVNQVLQQGLATAEHGTFVAKLKETAAKSQIR